jgi:hypothetical protein
VRDSLNGKSSKRLRRVVALLIASGTAATHLAYAWPSDRPIVLGPAALPEVARQPGQALLLHESPDGRTLLYVEQNQGARLAVFDVTHPEHVKSDGAVQLDAPGPFDFVSTVGKRAEVVRFREGNGIALLDLDKADAPVLKTAQRLTLLDSTTPLVAQGVSASRKIAASGQVSQDYQLVATDSVEEYKGVPDASQIREQVTKLDTGTTFLLTESGLYEIRRPAAERAKERREDEQRVLYAGG